MFLMILAFHGSETGRNNINLLLEKIFSQALNEIQETGHRIAIKTPEDTPIGGKQNI